MKDKINKFKIEVITASQNPSFIHHEWFVKYHLEIVEKIAMELCDLYTKADRDLVTVLVWLHDYGKILNFENQYETTVIRGRLKLEELDFPRNFIDKTIQFVETADRKNDIDLRIDDIPIEVKILSSADGASHLIGPFMYIFWKEYASKSIEELIGSGIKKAAKDWEKKIVLPEVKKAFEKRHAFFLEQSGMMPEKFLE